MLLWSQKEELSSKIFPGSKWKIVENNPSSMTVIKSSETNRVTDSTARKWADMEYLKSYQMID